MTERNIPIDPSDAGIDGVSPQETIQSGPTELILLGVIHNDPKGRERVIKALEHFQPDVVTVEYAERSREEIEGITAMIADSEGIKYFVDYMIENAYPQANKDTLAAWIQASYFEYSGAREYCDRTGIPLLMIDSNYPANPMEATTSQLQEDPTSRWNTSLHQVLQGTQEELVGSIDSSYERRGSLLERGEARVSEMEYRDSAMVQRLQGLIGRVVHIGGILHFGLDYRQYGGGQNLQERLSHLNPQFIPLREVDNL